VRDLRCPHKLVQVGLETDPVPVHSQ
jgi:hypothetical protein